MLGYHEFTDQKGYIFVQVMSTNYLLGTMFFFSTFIKQTNSHLFLKKVANLTGHRRQHRERVADPNPLPYLGALVIHRNTTLLVHYLSVIFCKVDVFPQSSCPEFGARYFLIFPTSINITYTIYILSINIICSLQAKFEI